MWDYNGNSASIFQIDVNEFEIVNAGIPGYTTYQELEFLKIYGLEMNPDMVILGFVFNDVYYKYLHKPEKIDFWQKIQQFILIGSTFTLSQECCLRKVI